MRGITNIPFRICLFFFMSVVAIPLWEQDLCNSKWINLLLTTLTLRSIAENPSPTWAKWRKVAYGGMQPGFDDNHTDESFLEGMVMDANVVKRDVLKVMQDSVSISQYLCIVARRLGLDLYFQINSWWNFPLVSWCKPSWIRFSSSPFNWRNAFPQSSLALFT